MTVQQLREAKKRKYDEFYTRYQEIEAEVNAYLDYDPDTFANKTVLLPCDDPEWSNFTLYFAQNFKKLKLRKVISTSYAADSKDESIPYEPTLFEQDSQDFDQSRTRRNGKIFVLDHDINKNGRIDIDDIQWSYLNGDGDFRSDEVTKLRDEADIICTNPPFSLFREFFKWINENNKKYLIMGNINLIICKEIFPFFNENKTWIWVTIHGGARAFYVPKGHILKKSICKTDSNDGKQYVLLDGIRWFTNIDHGRRHEPLILMTKADNLRYSKHKEIRGKSDYEHYDNLDAIEVPYVDAIPSDYGGVMGVPISFLDKYCPEQFEIVRFRKGDDGKNLLIRGREPFSRILIKHRSVTA